MKSASTKLLPPLLYFFLLTRLQAADEPKLSPVPSPVSNNAVAISRDEGGARIFSCKGIGPKTTWDAITTSAYELENSGPAFVMRNGNRIIRDRRRDWAEFGFV